MKKTNLVDKMAKEKTVEKVDELLGVDFSFVTLPDSDVQDSQIVTIGGTAPTAC